MSTQCALHVQFSYVLVPTPISWVPVRLLLVPDSTFFLEFGTITTPLVPWDHYHVFPLSKGKWLFATSGFSTLLSNVIWARVFPQHIRRVKTKRSVNITDKSSRWNKGLSFLSFCSCFGGMNRECSRFFSHAAEHLAIKTKMTKNATSSWITARLDFALIRSCLLCLKGAKTSPNMLWNS